MNPSTQSWSMFCSPCYFVVVIILSFAFLWAPLHAPLRSQEPMGGLSCRKPQANPLHQSYGLSNAVPIGNAVGDVPMQSLGLLASDSAASVLNLHSMTKATIAGDTLQTKIEELFNHAFIGYMEHAFPGDELRPLTCTGRTDPRPNTANANCSTTLIDSLGALLIFGRYEDFERAVDYISQVETMFDTDRFVSGFEVNIRILGGLLSGHLCAVARADRLRTLQPTAPSWTYEGALLKMAHNLGLRLLKAFDTPTGLPYAGVNLRNGSVTAQTTVSSAEAGSYLIEFGILSLLTDNPIFYKTARRATLYLWKRRSSLNLLPDWWDVISGEPQSNRTGIGASSDSYFEYLVKAAILFNDPILAKAGREGVKALHKHCQKDGFYASCNTQTGGALGMPSLSGLGAFWPSLQLILGNFYEALTTYTSYFILWKKYEGVVPEMFDLIALRPHTGYTYYLLRPEFFEATFYFRKLGMGRLARDVANLSTYYFSTHLRTLCGFAQQLSSNYTLENIMESFVLSETLVYLYLNVVPLKVIEQRLSVPFLDGIFSTEAHLFPLPWKYPEVYYRSFINFDITSNISDKPVKNNIIGRLARITGKEAYHRKTPVQSQHAKHVDGRRVILSSPFSQKDSFTLQNSVSPPTQATFANLDIDTLLYPLDKTLRELTKNTVLQTDTLNLMDAGGKHPPIPLIPAVLDIVVHLDRNRMIFDKRLASMIPVNTCLNLLHQPGSTSCTFSFYGFYHPLTRSSSLTQQESVSPVDLFDEGYNERALVRMPEWFEVTTAMHLRPIPNMVNQTVYMPTILNRILLYRGELKRWHTHNDVYSGPIGFEEKEEISQGQQLSMFRFPRTTVDFDRLFFTFKKKNTTFYQEAVDVLLWNTPGLVVIGVDKGDLDYNRLAGALRKDISDYHSAPLDVPVIVLNAQEMKLFDYVINELAELSSPHRTQKKNGNVDRFEGILFRDNLFHVTAVTYKPAGGRMT